MAEGARIAEAAGAEIIDINMGCPARHVTGGQSGSALMRDLDHALKLIEATISAVKVPVTLKMRLGWDDRSLNAPELARRAEAAGVQMISVHGRTRCQFYKGEADWGAVRAVKDTIGIPLVVNGDITSFEKAVTALEMSGADAVSPGCPARSGAASKAVSSNPRRRWRSSSNISARSMMKFAATMDCASAFAMRASISVGRWKSQPNAAARRRRRSKAGDKRS